MSCHSHLKLQNNTKVKINWHFGIMETTVTMVNRQFYHELLMKHMRTE